MQSNTILLENCVAEKNNLFIINPRLRKHSFLKLRIDKIGLKAGFFINLAFFEK